MAFKDSFDARRGRRPVSLLKRFNEAMQGPRLSIHHGIRPVTVDASAQRSEQNHGPDAWLDREAAGCPMHLSPDLLRACPKRDLWNRISIK